jgi:homoserine kinase
LAKKSFRFRVPATSANLGPGFGVLGVALDLHMEVGVEVTEAPELVVERADQNGSHALDLRHDSIVRGLRSAAETWQVKVPPGLVIRAKSDIPRGCGLGSNSAEFVAGIRAALQFAKVWPTVDEQLGLLVQLGGDPAHGAAALSGGLVVAVPIHAPSATRAFRTLPHPLHDSWRFIVVAPDSPIGTADVHRVVPAALPNSVVQRTAGRAIGLLAALADGDEGLLAPCLVDEVHVPFRMTLVPGMREAMDAARAAGAAGVTISGHGPALIAMTTREALAEDIAKEMEAAFSARGVRARSLVCRAEPEPTRDGA